MLQITQDPETQQVLTAMAMMNMEGEGVQDANAYFRKKLLRMGVVKPTDDEAQELMAEMQGQPQDPNSIYLQAAAEEATAKAAQARANTVKTVADAELSRAKTVETLSNVDIDTQDHALKLAEQIGGGIQQQATATTQPV
jgi:ABC-type oligopeptide transport system ATPase subunit